MCGICGIWQSTKPEKDLLRSMNSALWHRGPDDEGYYFDGPVGLGHRRLSIIDNGTIWIVFNGKIYNFPELRGKFEAKGHRFKSATGTEDLTSIIKLLSRN